MDWENVQADEYRKLPRNYTAGRQGRRITGITVHHMAGNLSIDGCYSLWSHSGTSAHYAVQADGRIGQMVDDADTAWACGNWEANLTTISVEHANNGSSPWTVGEAALDAGAHLVAALCRYYGLGRPEWMSNVFPHRHWSATACPGELYGSQKHEYIDRCKYWYDKMAGGSPSEPERSAPAPVPSPKTVVDEIRYCVRTEANGWLAEMVGLSDTGGSGDDYAGDGSPILYLAMDFPGWYQVRTEGQGWLPKVSRYDVGDLEDGCAGDGTPITGVRCYYETQDPDATGWKVIEYAVANVGGGFLSPMRDLSDTGGSGDDFAGNGGRVSAIRARVADA
ncbi:MAG: peptidoglycan recognition family protein [Berryella intestinalis]|uniref:peptidoglycan recognition protein family protein n=1 Tax=Berryella intestinalis TaxID=1531429 RepID=UPI002A754075|nr:peptidoglycan recognition family protein [Berryella intestinalis]MDY3129506.1 peptidoglycan recognition family protein [Berryella intestinalis]